MSKIKNERIYLRIEPDLKQIFKRIAKSEGLTLSVLIINSVLAVSKKK